MALASVIRDSTGVLMKALVNILVVGTAGFIGAITRWGVGALALAIAGRSFPFATLIINITASFLLGWFGAWAFGKVWIADWQKLAVTTGFIGTYSTFSTYMYEALDLYRNHHPLKAVIYVLASTTLGLLAVWCGYVLGAKTG